MTNPSLSQHSKTDLDFLRSAQDADIDFSDNPEITEEQLANAKIRLNNELLADEMDDTLFSELLESIREGGAILRREKEASRTFVHDTPSSSPKK